MTPALLLLSSLFLAPSPARAQAQVPSGVSVSQDPLAEQIRLRQLTEPNGGVTAVVRLADGQALPLQLAGLDQPLGAALPDAGRSGTSALKPLRVHPGLLPRGRAAEKRSGRELKAASKQLRRIKAKSWAESRGHRRAL